MVELYGLKPNGQPINSNPYSKHSDGDGLEDNEELHFSREKMTYELDKSQYDGSVFVWSDPCLDDTDGDGLNDKEEREAGTNPRVADTDGDGIDDFYDSNPTIPYKTQMIWQRSDQDYSTVVQIELLKLHLAWRLAKTDTEKLEIESSADDLRDKVSSGILGVLDTVKTITGAAADEFSLFGGGDAGRAERDYWLYEVNKFDPEIKIEEEKTFHAIMFIAGLISPSPDDAWKLISKKASKEMLETVGETGAKKFLKSIGKYAGAQGSNGIKKLKGAGIKGFTYEVKVKGKNGAYRLLGNKTENGEIFWEVFEKTHK